MEGEPDNVAVISLAGEIDLATAPDAERRIAAAEKVEPSELVIDLREVTFMDSSGLRVLLAAHHRAGENSRDFALVSGPAVARLLEMTGLTGRIRLLDEPPAPGSGSPASD
jgi:anti-sigma B factor antagonist